MLNRETIYNVIFGTDTPAGKRFDLALIWAILISVAALTLDSIQDVNAVYGTYLDALEWFFTIAFTLEYVLRVYCSPNRRAYIFSFYGLIDLLSTLPSYLELFIPGGSYLLVIRLLRVFRIFRILKLIRYGQEANLLLRSLWMSRRKIAVFFSFVAILTTIFGCIMFVIEGPDNGFTSIPRSIYWAIVTITTVGYGDITPQTVLGQAIAAVTMLTGYSVIAIPTGIITAELANEMRRDRSTKVCTNCARSDHDKDADYCKYCSSPLEH
ncbi:Cyclic nucleotide-gated potassium channel [BD1-7 clade bacterium]|uniref:Cyclic nucleotide-gated potassium channel n=1 Tax=BD1-7 clade bacterium TaxID=2029982 RepID=A0A5S9MRW2_9GAMM|nr:Cyclic nucleotide-gated potassium channel [BD1-7 clade bacterium]